MADDVLAAGRRAAQAGSHQINEQPLTAVIGGFALGYVADFLLHGRPVTAETAGDPKWREALKATRDPLCTR